MTTLMVSSITKLQQASEFTEQIRKGATSMAIEDMKQLKTVNNQGPAQALIDQGWTLLAVCVKQDGSDQYAEYHLGKPAPVGLTGHGALLSGDGKV
ncbi:hypothetical protein [Pseudomonas syringae]|uniref:hypothetical protein n=1 Tax=Pseudomonas syringae TaxID=317 RepID=UPI0021560018|nr:hypothetical protein [Pseudomonas syringae]